MLPQELRSQSYQGIWCISQTGTQVEWCAAELYFQFSDVTKERILRVVHFHFDDATWWTHKTPFLDALFTRWLDTYLRW